jgi:hypothetical protein
MLGKAVEPTLRPSRSINPARDAACCRCAAATGQTGPMIIGTLRSGASG